MVDGTKRRTLDELLDEAKTKIERYSPDEAQAAVAGGALIIDIRTSSDRERDGIVPGSVHIPRTVLEWRLELGGASRSPYVGGADEPVILLCDHGYSTILAAATLTDLGFSRAGDVIGGFAGWRDAGLPVAPAPIRPRPAGQPAGMNGPD